MTRRSINEPEQPFEADLAAKLRAQFIESVDPALEQRHLAAMTKAFQAPSTRPMVAAGHPRRTMRGGFLASTAAKVAAAVFAAAIATGTALAATGNLDILPAAEKADSKDASESGNEKAKADAGQGAGAPKAQTGAQTAAEPTPSPTPDASAAPAAQQLPTEPDNCDEADSAAENDDENDPEDGLEGMECDGDGATTAGTGNSEETQEEDVD